MQLKRVWIISYPLPYLKKAEYQTMHVLYHLPVGSNNGNIEGIDCRQINQRIAPGLPELGEQSHGKTTHGVECSLC